MSHSRVTIAKIALAAGVSKMTVSRALRGDRGISEEMRQRIVALAQEMDYRPDPAVSQLMGRLRKSRFADLEPLAWLTTYKTIGGWKTNPGTCDMYKGAVEQAHRLGYRLEEFSVGTAGMSPRRLSDILYSRSIRGIVLAPLLEHGAIEDFNWQHFATACCGHSLLSPALHRVSVDQFDVLRTAWERLRRLGYHRIGLCVPATDNARIGYRWQGALLLEEAALEPEAVRVPAMITDEWTPQRFLQWYHEHRPDVVLSFPEVAGWMRQAGIRIAQDCSFALIRLDNSTGVAGVNHRFSDIGAAAVGLVVSGINANEYGIPKVRQSVSIECQWQDGPTVRRRQPL